MDWTHFSTSRSNPNASPNCYCQTRRLLLTLALTLALATTLSLTLNGCLSVHGKRDTAHGTVPMALYTTDSAIEQIRRVVESRAQARVWARAHARVRVRARPVWGGA